MDKYLIIAMELIMLILCCSKEALIEDLARYLVVITG